MAEARRKPMDENTVKSIIAAELSNCGSTSSSELSNERATNLDYYFARPFGNEVEGHSTVVSTDVRDTIEWIIPILVRIFTAGEKIVQFEPQGQEDEEAAEQATDYADYIWNRDNPGFLNLYSWIKDGLLEKNGTVKIWWDATPITKRENYSGLDDQAFAQLVNDPDVEVSEHTETKTAIPATDPATGMPKGEMVTLHDVVLTRTLSAGKVCIEAMPPEEFLVSRNARAIDTARLVAHKKRVTLSSLIEEGFDKSLVMGLSGDDDNGDTNAEALARNTVETNSIGSNADDASDESMREVWRTECYIKMDYDGDGIAEMRKVTVAGNGNTILSNEAWDTPRPFADWTPIILPHRRNGLAFADLIRDLQLIRSTILRQYLNNLYLRNNQREEVVASNIVEPSEVLSSKPGMKIRVKAAGSINPIIVPDVGAAALQGMEYTDRIMEKRTGVSERTQGLGEDALHDTLGGERMLMTAAMGKIELVARVFAETGFKNAFRLIHKLNCVYQQKQRVIRLRNDWVPMDPSQWNSDMDMTVSVGMGTGDKEIQLRHAMLLAQIQEKAAMLQPGSVSPDNFMETAEIIVNSMGMKGVERFFTKVDPNQPKPPSPEMMKVQAQAEADKTKAQIDAQSQAAQMQMDGQMKSAQMQQDGQMKSAQMMQEGQIKQMQMQSEIELRARIADAELALKERQLAAELNLKERQMAAELELKRQDMKYRAEQQSSDIGNVELGGAAG